MREALALKGQAPHTAIVGCADSRVPLETVFDALPGDLFVLRNAGNTCTLVLFKVIFGHFGPYCLVPFGDYFFDFF